MDIKSLFSERAQDNNDFVRSVIQPTQEEFEQIQAFIEVFPDLMNIDYVNGQFLALLGDFLGYKYLEAEDPEVQRDIMKRVVKVYHQKGSEGLIRLAGAYAWNPNYAMGTMTYYHGDIQPGTVNIDYPRDRMFQYDVSRWDRNTQWGDYDHIMHGVIDINLSKVSDRTYTYLDAIIPGGIKYYVNIMKDIGDPYIFFPYNTEEHDIWVYLDTPPTRVFVRDAYYDTGKRRWDYFQWENTFDEVPPNLGYKGDEFTESSDVWDEKDPYVGTFAVLFPQDIGYFVGKPFPNNWDYGYGKDISRSFFQMNEDRRHGIFKDHYTPYSYDEEAIAEEIFINDRRHWDYSKWDGVELGELSEQLREYLFTFETSVDYEAKIDGNQLVEKVYDRFDFSKWDDNRREQEKSIEEDISVHNTYKIRINDTEVTADVSFDKEVFEWDKSKIDKSTWPFVFGQVVYLDNNAEYSVGSTNEVEVDNEQNENPWIVRFDSTRFDSTIPFDGPQEVSDEKLIKSMWASEAFGSISYSRRIVDGTVEENLLWDENRIDNTTYPMDRKEDKSIDIDVDFSYKISSENVKSVESILVPWIRRFDINKNDQAVPNDGITLVSYEQVISLIAKYLSGDSNTYERRVIDREEDLSYDESILDESVWPKINLEEVYEDLEEIKYGSSSSREISRILDFIENSHIRFDETRHDTEVPNDGKNNSTSEEVVSLFSESHLNTESSYERIIRNEDEID